VRSEYLPACWISSLQLRVAALQQNPTIAKIYAKEFQLAYVVTLREHQLSTDIHVSNPSTSEALDFQALLHNYVRAPANEVSISPLLGKRYIDKTEKSVEARKLLKEEKRSVVDVRAFTDFVYEDTPPKVDVSWPGGGLVLQLRGFTTLTVWNPQAESGSGIGDMEENGWWVSSLLFFDELLNLYVGNGLSASSLDMQGGSSDWKQGNHG
jgi:glucose-6-phosphate 1-epimerase